MEIRITKTTMPKRKPDENNLPFGTFMTDHMFIMHYDTDQGGWHDPEIVPYGPITLDPACSVFHYAQECFEGMKAYRTAEGRIQLFRPMENVRRMNTSCERLCIPQLPEDVMYRAIKTLVEVDQDWVPHLPGTSLYIRPFVFGTENYVGLRIPDHFLCMIICCPVGNYYKEGINPVKIIIEDRDVRAVRGGTGYTKAGANYAISMRAENKAEQSGYTQVLWLDGVHRKYIEEVGSMNVMFKIAGKVVTPELAGSVLPGITRKSCIEMMRHWGLDVEERLISVEELMEAIENGTLEEAWGTGTAAVVSPIGVLNYEGKEYTVGNGGIGQVTQRLYDELTGIQWGRQADPFHWVDPVC